MDSDSWDVNTRLGCLSKVFERLAKSYVFIRHLDRFGEMDLVDVIRTIYKYTYVAIVIYIVNNVRYKLRNVKGFYNGRKFCAVRSIPPDHITAAISTATYATVIPITLL